MKTCDATLYRHSGAPSLDAMISILVTIRDHPGVTREAICYRVGVSRATFSRALARWRRCFGVVVEWSHAAGYRIVDAGSLHLSHPAFRPSRQRSAGSDGRTRRLSRH